MSFLRYSEYRDSGVEWLGEVPGHWEVLRARHMVVIKKRIAGELGHDVLSVTQGGLRVRDIDSNDGQLSMDYSKYQIVEIGDFAMNGMDLLTGWVDIAESAGVTSPDYRVFSIRDSTRTYPRYLLYLMQMGYTNRIFFAYGQGSSQLGRWRFPTEEFRSFAFPAPPLPEQHAIAAFLDRETARIDALIAEQQKLIALLKEKRQAVISHAVTKGLDPNVPMKDSGVEWLGMVPGHWDVAPVSARYNVQLGKMLDTTKITGRDLRPYLRVIDVQWGAINTVDLPEMDFDEEIRAKFRLNRGDILVNEGGSYPGRSAIWSDEIGECYYQKALHRLRLHRPATDDSRFFYFVMVHATNHGVFVAGGNEATIEHLPAEKLRRYRFAFPSLDEQLLVVAFLDHETSRLDTLTTEATNAITLLQERRTALISAAVTGKIDVRSIPV